MEADDIGVMIFLVLIVALGVHLATCWPIIGWIVAFFGLFGIVGGAMAILGSTTSSTQHVNIKTSHEWREEALTIIKEKSMENSSKTFGIAQTIEEANGFFYINFKMTDEEFKAELSNRIINEEGNYVHQIPEDKRALFIKIAYLGYTLYQEQREANQDAHNAVMAEVEALIGKHSAIEAPKAAE